jgi:hypothetical protein
MHAAKDAGLTPNRSALRSFCWNEKQNGRLTQSEVGRYISSRYRMQEAADPTPSRESAASAPPHYQHRSGDAGGGI